jgi:hypothetical protein
MILHREPGETLEEVVAKNGDAVHLRVARVVVKALEDGLERAHILTVLPDQYELFCTKGNYLDSLVTNLPHIEAQEEYELCQKMHNWISELKYKKYRDDEEPKKIKIKKKKKDEENE